MMINVLAINPQFQSERTGNPRRSLTLPRGMGVVDGMDSVDSVDSLDSVDGMEEEMRPEIHLFL